MANSSESFDVTVFGSFMIDLTVFCPRMPGPGETLIGHQFARGFGGKGANQAAMCRFLGARCAMAGCLGDDDFGRDYRRHFEAEGITLALKDPPQGVSTGVAPITVTDSGENHIVIVVGANGALTADDVTTPGAVIGRAVESARVLLCQLEVPIQATEAAMRLARSVGAITILNVAPMPEGEEDRARVRAALPLADIVCANESEAAALCDVSADYGDAIGSWLSGMSALGCRQPLVTLGADGAAFLDGDGAVRRVSAPSVTAVDTTGAGDCFLGALGALLAEGETMEEAVTAAVRVASFSVTKKGTQRSYPRGAEARRVMAGTLEPR